GILFAAALFVGWRTRGLLIGEAATVADRRRIREAVEGVPQVVALLQVLTLHLGPEDVLVNLNVNFADGLDTDALEAAIDEIEKRIRAAVPTAKRIFIEAESIRGIGA
ncbi:MAG: cation diffusion facilitator family transporter, partial [Planctomycetota bacterium]